MSIQLHPFHLSSEYLMSAIALQSGLLCPGAVALDSFQGNSHRTQGKENPFLFNSGPFHGFAGGQTQNASKQKLSNLQFGPGDRNHPRLMS